MPILTTVDTWHGDDKGSRYHDRTEDRARRAENAAHSAKVEAIIAWVRDNGALIDQTPSAKVTINVKGQQVKGDITIYPDSKV